MTMGPKRYDAWKTHNPEEDMTPDERVRFRELKEAADEERWKARRED